MMVSETLLCAISPLNMLFCAFAKQVLVSSQGESMIFELSKSQLKRLLFYELVYATTALLLVRLLELASVSSR